MNWPGICVALATASAPAFPVLAQNGDAARGAGLFPIRCIECHAIRVSDRQEDGPNLSGLIGRTSGSQEGDEFSDTMKGAGIGWSEETLITHLVAPRKVVPGTRMNFNGLKRPGEAEDIVAYLPEIGQ